MADMTKMQEASKRLAEACREAAAAAQRFIDAWNARYGHRQGDTEK